MRKTFYTATGLYALFCLWTPVFWFMDSNPNLMGAFEFSRLQGVDQTIFIIITLLSLSTTFYLACNLKDTK